MPSAIPGACVAAEQTDPHRNDTPNESKFCHKAMFLHPDFSAETWIENFHGASSSQVDTIHFRGDANRIFRLSFLREIGCFIQVFSSLKTTNGNRVDVSHLKIGVQAVFERKNVGF